MPDVGDEAGEPVDCREAVARLYHYLDGELTADRRALIQRHLSGCTDCIEAFEFEAELRMVISRRCRDTVPEALRSRIAASLRLPPFGTA